MAAALALARAAVEAGTTLVVATPHVSSRWADNDALRIANAVLLLRRELEVAGIALDVQQGAEVALTRAVDLPAEELRRLRLPGGRWLLLECPSDGVAFGVDVMLRGLVADGHELLLAHPERIPAFREDPGVLKRLVDDGLRCQVTAGAFTGRFGREVERFSARLLQQGLVHVVASDAHAVTGRPPTMLAELRQAGLSDELVGRLTTAAPAAILAGEDPRPGGNAASGAMQARLARRASGRSGGTSG